MPEQHTDPTRFVSAAAVAGASLPIVEGIVALSHGGVVGGIVGIGVSGLVWLLADEATQRGRGIHLPASLPRPRRARPGQQALFSRLLTGKDDREEVELRDEMKEPPAFTLSSLLATGWRPSLQQIFLARLADGRNIFVSVEDLVHIALAGSTRQGKTSIIRQLLVQLCSVGCRCVLLDPHYTPYDVGSGEDWTPFTPFLSQNPMETRQYARIEQVVRYTATSILEQRKLLRASSKPVGRHIVLLLDEYPSIVAACPEIQEHVGFLLREGAKFNIHLCVASQDFQVKTVSPQAGGALRENYRTCLYVGGDTTTARVLLDTTVPKEVEATLGKGTVMLRCLSVKQGEIARTPLTDNQALYTLLGPSTYHPATSTRASTARPVARPPEETGRHTEALGGPLDAQNADVPLPAELRSKVRLILELDEQSASQNDIIRSAWGIEKPDTRQGRVAKEELKEIRAYLAARYRAFLMEA